MAGITITALEVVKLVEKKQVPLCVRHGIAALMDSSRRVIKKTKRGNYRTKQRKKIKPRTVPKSKKGFVDAFRIIVGSWMDYGYIKKSIKNGVNLTSKGMELERIHRREVDSKTRLRIFENNYRKLLREEIKTYNGNKDLFNNRRVPKTLLG